MSGSKKKKNSIQNDRSRMATGIVIAVIIVLLVGAYLIINAALRERSFRRMEEGVDTVIQEVTAKLDRESRLR